MNQQNKSEYWSDDRKIFGRIRFGYIKVAFFLIGIIIASFFVTGRVVADNAITDTLITNQTVFQTTNQTINQSYVVVTDVTPVIPSLENRIIPHIMQGDVVHPGDIVDITGVSGWPDDEGDYHLAWYGQYVTGKSPGGLDPKYIITLPGKSRSGTVPSQYTFYLDETIFGPRPGYWFQYISNATAARFDFEYAGNLQVFRVSNDIVTITNKSGNVTTAYVNGTYEEKKIAPEPLMPEVRVADYLVAKGDPIEMEKDHCKVWIFGSRTGKYGLDCGPIDAKTIESLEIGDYTMILQYPGNNTIYDAVYAGNEILPGLYGKKPMNIEGFDPQTIMDRFLEMLKGSDDITETKKIVVQDPYITMERLDEIYVEGQPVYDIRGYSNTQSGTKITITLDEGQTYFKNIRHNAATTTTVRTSPGNKSYYQAYLAIDYDQLAAMATMHTLKAKLPSGQYVEHDVKISTMPADSFKPNATIKFTEARNPFVPTPTPVTIIQEKIVPGPTQIVKVTITPSQEQIHTEGEAIAKVWFIAGIIILVVIIVAMVAVLWIYSIYRRARVIK